jgi:type III secretion protein K
MSPGGTLAGQAPRSRAGTLAGATRPGLGGTSTKAPPSPATWPTGPHAADMIAFNQLPSRSLHPSRWAALLPPGWPAPQPDDHAAHRHASALILRQLGPGASLVTDWQRPEWPLALLPEPRFTRLLHRMGLVLVQRSLRQAISGAELRPVAALVGDDELTWARTQAPALAAALEHGPAAPALAELPARLPQLAAGVLAHAVAASPLAMRLRLLLRAPATPPPQAQVDATSAAWALACHLIDDLEPTWRSSFPSTH